MIFADGSIGSLAGGNDGAPWAVAGGKGDKVNDDLLIRVSKSSDNIFVYGRQVL